MSYKHLTYSGIDDKNLILDDLTINNTLTVENLTSNGNITGNNLISNNDLTVDNDAVVSGNITSNGNITGNNLISNNDLTVDNDTIVNGNITSNSQIFSSESTTTGSLGHILLNESPHVWSAGQGAGVNTLNITGLNGDTDFMYKIYIGFGAQPTNTNNYLSMTLNSKTNSNYSSRITQNTSGLIDNSNQTTWRWLDVNSSSDKFGCGEFILWCNKSSNINLNPCMTGVYSSQLPGNNSTQNYKSSYTFNDPVSLDQITSLQIDVSNGNHNGWKIYIRLERIR